MGQVVAGITLPQALLVLGAIWLLGCVSGPLIDMVRRWLGKPPRPGDHCEHCDIIDTVCEDIAGIYKELDGLAVTVDGGPGVHQSAPNESFRAAG